MTAAKATLLAIALALLMNWQLVRHLTAAFPGYTDSLVISWNIAWGGYALLHRPFALLEANSHYPLGHSLAFMDSLLGYALAVGWLASSPEQALLLHNLLFLFTFVLAFLGAWLLAREIGMSPRASVVAGIAYAYAPWRAAHIGHLHVLSSGAIPLAIALLVRGYRTGDRRFVMAGWLIATWQLMLGYTLGLMLAYLLAGLLALGMGWWLRKGRPQLGSGVVRASLVGMVVFFGWGALQSIPYWLVSAEHPQAVRTADEVAYYSPSPSGLLRSPEANLFWGPATDSLRAGLAAPDEQSIFPGALALGLAMLGLLSPALGKRLRGLLLAIAAVTMVLSFGLRGPGAPLYQWILEHLPGWQGIRTPGRLATLTALSLALLAASGVQMLIDECRRGAFARNAVVALLASILLCEGAYRLGHRHPPPRPAALRDLASPLMHLPSDHVHDALYMYWSIGDFPRIANGHAAFVPRAQGELRRLTAGFPDLTSVTELRSIGVRTVVFHPDLARGTASEGAQDRPVQHLRIGRRAIGNVVVFDLNELR